MPAGVGAESRRDEEEGGELDSHEEVAQERSRAGRWSWARELVSWCFTPRQPVRLYQGGLRVGLLLLQLFPNGGATDFAFVTVLHSSWDSNCVVRWSLRNAGRTLP